MSYLIFTDQQSFMRYSLQEPSPETAALYRDLIKEEAEDELTEAWDAHVANPTPETIAEVADACIDTIYVTIGLLHALGLDPQALWDEVQRANIAKMKHPCPACAHTDTPGRVYEGDAPEPITCQRCNGQAVVYEVRKREDGKTLKPQGWEPPNLLPLIRAMLDKRA